VKNKIKKFVYIICLFVLSQGILSSVCAVENFQFSAQLNAPEDMRTVFERNLSEYSSDVVFTEVPRGLVVSVNSTVFFDDNSDELKESSKIVLNQIGSAIKSLNKPCIIEGNTKGETSVYNSDWEISIVRAARITNYLISEYQINPDNIRSIGFGEISPFLGKKLMPKNRIDFVIINYEEEKSK